MKAWILGAVALALSACATTAQQTEALLVNRGDLPEARDLGSLPYYEQSRNYCGPATLAMAMTAIGHAVTPDGIAHQVYTPGKKGSLQADMIAASRRQGLMAMQIYGLPNLLKELSAGHPVIVLENLAFSWYPMWHYSLAFGYDLRDPSLLMHSGSKQHWKLNLRKFERNWKYAQYWALVVLPPGELAATADELEHCAAAAGLEQAGFLREAEMGYRRILMRWPESLGALVGMGNVMYARGDYPESVRFLKLAVKAHPESVAAWNNLGVAKEALREQKKKLGAEKKSRVGRKPAKVLGAEAAG